MAFSFSEGWKGSNLMVRYQIHFSALLSYRLCKSNNIWNRKSTHGVRWDMYLCFLTCSILKKNQIDSTLDFGASFSNQLEFVNLQYNNIDVYKQPSSNTRIQVMYVSWSEIKMFFFINCLLMSVYISTGWQIIQCARSWVTGQVTAQQSNQIPHILQSHLHAFRVIRAGKQVPRAAARIQ